MLPLANLTQIFAASCGKSTFLGLVPWYEFLNFQDVGNGCEVVNPVLLGPHSILLLILLAVVDDLLRLAGLFAVIFIVYAGFKYVMSMGSPDETGKALASIRNAIGGLVTALVTIPLVSYLGSQFQGGSAGASKQVAGLNLTGLPFIPDVQSGNIVEILLKVAFAILGALSLLFIVIGGYNYIISEGEAGKVAKAKQTIIYALIGLAIAIVAQSTISFVIKEYNK